MSRPNNFSLRTYPKNSSPLITVFSDASLKDDAVGFAYWMKGPSGTYDGSGAFRAEYIEGKSGWAESAGITFAIFAAVKEFGGGADIVLQCDSLEALSFCRNFGKFAKTSKITSPVKAIPPELAHFAHGVTSMHKGKLWLKHVKGHSGGCNRTGVNNFTDRKAKEAREELESRGEMKTYHSKWEPKLNE